MMPEHWLVVWFEKSSKFAFAFTLDICLQGIIWQPNKPLDPLNQIIEST